MLLLLKSVLILYVLVLGMVSTSTFCMDGMDDVLV